MPELRIATVADNFDATVEFYRGVLGFALADTWDAADGRGAMFAVNGATLEVIEANAHHPYTAPAGVVVAIECDAVDQCYQRLQKAGVPVEEALGDREWGERSFTVRAPNGLLLGLFEALPGA